MPLVPTGPTGPGQPPPQIVIPGVPSGFLPMSANGVPILMPNGTISAASAVVNPGATPYVMTSAGSPPIIAMPANNNSLKTIKNGYIMASPAQEVPAGESKAPRGKEVQPWGVLSK